MAAKKYLTLEETADVLGISTKDLISLRERQEIRGFADRGTWKFKSEDVEEFQRRRQADSNPDVPMLSDDVGDQPTIIRKSVLDEEDVPRGTSDSDVRLIIDPSMAPASSKGKGGSSTNLADSDSDVRLIEDSVIKKNRKGADSQVRPSAALADSDSDVRLAGAGAKKGSDSDVHLVAPGGKKPVVRPESDSDVKLVQPRKPGDTIRAVPILKTPQAKSDSVLGDDDLILDDDSGLTLKAGSGISLEKLVDSGVSLEAGDSGIAVLGQNDDDDLITTPGSGILMSGGDSATIDEIPESGLELSSDDDSGIALADDSGIGLLGPSDSGIQLESPADSGISLESSDDLNQTIPMMAAHGGGTDHDQTNLEVPSLDDDGSNYELKMPGADSSDDVADTSVILFDDESDVQDHAATQVRKKPAADDGEAFDLEEAGESFDAEDDLEVAEDVVGEDDELDDMDVFDAADEDFDESFSAGESHAEFVAPTRGAVVAPVEQEWGGPTFAGLLISTGLMALCGMVMFDLVRSMWGWQEPNPVTGAILNAVGGMFSN